jgi:hypothetical protein
VLVGSEGKGGEELGRRGERYIMISKIMVTTAIAVYRGMVCKHVPVVMEGSHCFAVLVFVSRFIGVVRCI